MTDPGYPPPPTSPPVSPGTTTPPPPYAPGVTAADVQPAPAPSRAKKWLGVAGSVAVAGVAGASWLGLGSSAPAVGDCVAAKGESSFDVVDCAADEAEHRVVGIEPAEMSYDDYMADDGLCADFTSAQMVLWVGDTGSDGTVLCAEPV